MSSAPVLPVPYWDYLLAPLVTNVFWSRIGKKWGMETWAVVRGKHGHTHRLCEYASFHTMGYSRFRVNRASMHA